MTAYPEAKIKQLCQSLQIDITFFTQCLDESAIEIQETDNQLELSNASAFRLRRLQRLCDTLDVEPPVALLLIHLLDRIAELEKQVRPR